LDDGYQHLPLHRDLDILLIDSHIGFGDHHLLPRGILREPLSIYAEPIFFFLLKWTILGPRDLWKNKSGTSIPSTSVSQPLPADEPRGPHGEEELDLLKGKKVLALSGIANPDSFSSLLRKCEMEIVSELIFPITISTTQRFIFHKRKKQRSRLDCHDREGYVKIAEIGY